MSARRPSENRLEVELVSVDVNDADARLRLAYKLLLRRAVLVDLSDEGENADRAGDKEVIGE